ncbi:MAG TPA: phosphotransferase [Thermomicrobiales bacterium]|jgi:aminoglycoside phosphotransferase (APT) family kinase protein
MHDTAPYLTELQKQLTRHYPAWRPTALTIAGAGLNFLVCRAETDTLGSVALRVPWVRTLVNDTDGTLDARRLLEQEAALTAHAGRHGVAVPAIHALHLGTDGYDFLASGFVVGDGSAPNPRAFGWLMRAIHALPIPDVALIEAGAATFHERIATRLTARAQALARLTGVALPLPPREAIVDALAPRAAQRAILHMDARPANLFTRRGEIVAIADWGNALFGDPALELARIAESGHLSDGFIAGYGEDPLGSIAPTIATLYRLDTVVMLAIVFINEAPDLEAARTMFARARALAERL